MECLNTLEDHIFEYWRFSVPLKDDPVRVKTSVFHIGNPIFTFNYLADIFFENIDVSKLKFRRIVFE